MESRQLTPLEASATAHYNSKTARKKLLRDPATGKYLYNRLTRCQFLTLCIFIVMLLLTIILVPLFYLVVVPKLIRDKIRDLDLGSATLKRMHVSEFAPEGFNASLHATLPPQFPFPLTASISPFKLAASVSKDGKELHHLAELGLPSIPLSLHKEVVLDVNAYTSWARTDMHYFKDFFRVRLLNGLCYDRSSLRGMEFHPFLS